jgi:hypothetical protein
MNATYRQISQYVYSTAETQRQSYEVGDYLRNNSIDGDVVELGVAAGGNFATMLLGCREAGLNKKGWGFDSFQGIQLAGKKDTSQPGIGEITHDVDVPDEQLLKSSGITVHPKQNVIDNLRNWGLYNNVELVEGWVQETLPLYVDKIDKIAVLRLDMDIYHPTKIALEFLFEKVVKGGVVIIDDWALDGARLACEEYFESIKYKPKYIGVPNSTPIYFYK